MISSHHQNDLLFYLVIFIQTMHIKMKYDELLGLSRQLKPANMFDFLLRFLLRRCIPTYSYFCNNNVGKSSDVLFLSVACVPYTSNNLIVYIVCYSRKKYHSFSFQLFVSRSCTISKWCRILVLLHVAKLDWNLILFSTMLNFLMCFCIQ